MEQIKMKQNGGDVSVKIKIEGLIGWKFAFATTDIHEPFSKKSSKTNKNEFEFKLGSPEGLFLDNNNWGFVLVNVGNSKQEYEIIIKWMQDGTQLGNTWKAGGELEENQVAEETGKVRLIFEL